MERKAEGESWGTQVNNSLVNAFSRIHSNFFRSLRKRDEARRAEIVEENEALGAKMAALNEEHVSQLLGYEKSP